jgi:hypothetical protein
MALISDNALDAALAYIRDNTTHLYICSAEPTTYTEATSTYDLGSKAAPTIAVPSNRTGGGRRILISAITDGSVSATGTASHFALVDTGSSELLVAEALGGTLAVESGGTFTLTQFEVGIPDAV